MISIVESEIDSEGLRKKMLDQGCGALAVFEGWVRNHNEGHSVDSLEYEAYETLCLKEGQRIVDEAKNRFEITDVVCVHRVGHLQIGDSAVWIGATAPHRGAAFKACQYVIDEIKLRLPIWKKEHYTNKKAEWVNCQNCYQRSQLSFSEKDYYSKQVQLKSVGEAGQSRLKESKVLVVGAGGLGCPALTYLAAAGVGHITICDHDRIDATNLHRQTLFSFEDIGKSKAKLAKKRLQQTNPFVHIHAVSEFVQASNVAELVQGHDLILDCTDNFKTKFLLNDASKILRVPLVQASIYQSEGQVQSITNESSCLRCIWPDVPDASCVGNCAEVGVVGVVPGAVGALQAQEAISLLLGKDIKSKDSTILFDLEEMQFAKVKRVANKNCPLCGEIPQISSIEEKNYETELKEFEVHSKEISEMHETVLVDIRESSERNAQDSLMHMPMSQRSAFNKVSDDKKYVLVCAKGVRSKNLASQLRSLGKQHFYSLVGGIDSLRSDN